jgi:hypothetical protein
MTDNSFYLSGGSRGFLVYARVLESANAQQSLASAAVSIVAVKGQRTCFDLMLDCGLITHCWETISCLLGIQIHVKIGVVALHWRNVIHTGHEYMRDVHPFWNIEGAFKIVSAERMLEGLTQGRIWSRELLVIRFVKV